MRGAGGVGAESSAGPFEEQAEVLVGVTRRRGGGLPIMIGEFTDRRPQGPALGMCLGGPPGEIYSDDLRSDATTRPSADDARSPTLTESPPTFRSTTTAAPVSGSIHAAAR